MFSLLTAVYTVDTFKMIYLLYGPNCVYANACETVSIQ